MSAKFNATPKRTELVAVAGRWGLYKSTLSLARTQEQGANLVNITHHNLLPSGTDLVDYGADYVDLKRAREKSGLSYRKIIALCESGQVRAMKSGGKWMISLKSLLTYVSK